MTQPIHSVNIFIAIGFISIVIITVSILLEHLNE